MDGSGVNTGWLNVGLGGFLTCRPGPPFIFPPVHSFLQSAQDQDTSRTPICFRALRT